MFKKFCYNIQLNYKKELAKVVLSNVFICISSFIILYITLGQDGIVYSFLLVFATNILWYIYYLKLAENIKLQRFTDFINVFVYLKIYISNGHNVYISFSNIQSFVSNYYKDKISVLLANIDMDKSIQPYLAFIQGEKNDVVKDLMISIYQMVDNGTDLKYLSQFVYNIERLQEEHQISQHKFNESKLLFLSTMPIIGAGILVLTITISIILIIGEVINGF